jgi:flagellar biosynthesis regulator FlaF
MKKLFLSLTLIILVILVSVYGILFTKYGNNIISSYIEGKVNTGQEKVKLKVDDFTLTLNHLNFDAWINDDSKINISGELSLFQRNVDLKYDIKINDLSTLKNLTNKEFKGPLVTNGIFIGNEVEAIIQGNSDIAKSQTKYYFNLENFEPKNINIQMKNAKIEDILVLLNKPIYAKGDLNVIADIKNANLSELDGMVISKITNAKINNEVLNKELNQTLQSPITFQSDINAILTPYKAEIKSNITSSLAEIFMNRTIIDLETNNIKTDYKIDIKNLSKLEGIITKKLNGQFLTYGSLKSFDETIQIEGDSNVFEGISKYNLELVKNTPSFIKFSVENAKLEKILQVINEPIYSNGDVNIFGDIKNTNLDKLEGTINSRIINASIINEVASTLFKQNLQEKINYDLNIDTNLVPNQAISSTNIESTIGNLTTKKSIYDFKENLFMSDYLLNIPSLDKLKELVKMNLKGKMDINGEILNKNDSLLINGNSNILNGTFDFNFKNEKLNANLKNIDIQELSTMLDYSKFFDAKADFTLDYDFLLKKGDLNGKLLNGHFIENNFTQLFNQLTKDDLSKEVFETFDINSRIDNRVLTSNLIMKSQNSEINIQDSILDLEKDLIDTKINSKIKDKTFTIGLNGNAGNPKISIDTKDLLKDKIDKQIEKNKNKIKEKVNKVLG